MKVKEVIKKYRAFLLLVILNLVIWIISPKIGTKSFAITRDNFLEMLSIIPPIFILLGLLDVWVEKSTMIRYTGKGSGIKGVLISFLIGSAAAGPLYAAFPVATVMLKKGSSIFNVLIFIGAWSTTKIPMLTFEAVNLGSAFMLTRLVLSAIGLLLIAFSIEKGLKESDKKQIYAMYSEKP